MSSEDDRARRDEECLAADPVACAEHGPVSADDELLARANEGFAAHGAAADPGPDARAVDRAPVAEAYRRLL
jgi:hypothetical protein